MKVKDIMSSKIISIKPSETLTDASKLMKSNKISCLPVMDGTKVVGIITTTDLVNIYTSADKEAHMDPWSPVSKFMSTPVVTIDQDEKIKKASEIMTQKKFHHLIVVDKSKNIVGLISSLDIARAMN